MCAAATRRCRRRFPASSPTNDQRPSTSEQDRQLCALKQSSCQQSQPKRTKRANSSAIKRLPLLGTKVHGGPNPCSNRRRQLQKASLLIACVHAMAKLGNAGSTYNEKFLLQHNSSAQESTGGDAPRLGRTPCSPDKNTIHPQLYVCTRLHSCDCIENGRLKRNTHCCCMHFLSSNAFPRKLPRQPSTNPPPRKKKYLITLVQSI